MWILQPLHRLLCWVMLQVGCLPACPAWQHISSICILALGRAVQQARLMGWRWGMGLPLRPALLYNDDPACRLRPIRS